MIVASVEDAIAKKSFNFRHSKTNCKLFNVIVGMYCFHCENHMVRGLISIACVYAALGLHAQAATATGRVGVSLTMNATCTIGASAMNFGTRSNVGGSGNIDATGTVTVTCSNGAAFNVKAGNGANFSAGTRRMRNGVANFINYNLYLDAARTIPWPAAGGNGTGNGTTQVYSIFGRLPLGQPTVPLGVYTDTVQLTLTY